MKLDGDISESKTAHLVLVMEPQDQLLYIVNSTRLIVLSIAFVFSIAIKLMVDTLGLLMAFLLLIWGFFVAMEHRKPNILESVFEEWSEKGSVMYKGLCDVDFCSSEVFSLLLIFSFLAMFQMN